MIVDSVETRPDQYKRCATSDVESAIRSHNAKGLKMGAFAKRRSVCKGPSGTPRCSSLGKSFSVRGNSEPVDGRRASVSIRRRRWPWNKAPCRTGRRDILRYHLLSTLPSFVDDNKKANDPGVTQWMGRPRQAVRRRYTPSPRSPVRPLLRHGSSGLVFRGSGRSCRDAAALPHAHIAFQALRGY